MNLTNFYRTPRFWTHHSLLFEPLASVLKLEPVLCPVTAWRKWRLRADVIVPLDSDLPVFRFESGLNVTGAWLNSKLQMLLRWDIDYSIHGVLSHSFR